MIDNPCCPSLRQSKKEWEGAVYNYLRARLTNDLHSEGKEPTPDLRELTQLNIYLIIHRVWTEQFTLLILICIEFYDFNSLFLFLRFDWEGISATQDSAWPQLQTPWSALKVLYCASYFQLFSHCVEMWSNGRTQTNFDWIKKRLCILELCVPDILLIFWSCGKNNILLVCCTHLWDIVLATWT